ncbi:MAG: pol polyprotein, partial [Clostridium sp.]|uniref:pol polyprotein n=1 Tax=Clostridium sp. TaxID=1506 RepID=UPI003F3226A5
NRRQSRPEFRPKGEEPIYLLNPHQAAELQKTYEHMTFPMRIPNIPAEDSPKITVYKLVNTNIQDVLAWTTALRDLANTNQWTDETSQRVLDLLLKPDFKDAIKEKKTFDTKLDALCEKCFTITRYHSFKNLLYNTHRNKFGNLQKYIRFLQETRIRVDLCSKGKSEKMPEIELTQILIDNLSRKEKEALASKGSTTLDEITQELENFYDMESFFGLINTDSKSLNQQRWPDKTKYCKFHRSPFHNTNECRAAKKKQESTSNLGILQPPNQIITNTKRTHISLPITINNQTYSFIVDTGATENFISKDLADKIKIKPHKIHQPITLADGREINILEESELQFSIQHQGIFQENFKILKDLSYLGIIGHNFLQKHKFLVDCEAGIIEKKQQTPDRTIINKIDCMYISNDSFSELISKYQKNNPTLGRITTHKMSLPLNDDVPVHKRPYAVPISQIQAVKEEIKRLLKLGIIRNSNSVYASPAFAIPKKNGNIRLVIDYRELNKKTVKLGYPFPGIQYSLIDLKGARFFSQLDLNMGYYQIEIEEQDKYKTSFVLPFGQYEFNRMPFGLSNAPREFQRIMTEKLKDFDFVKIFVDDILIFSKTLKDHTEHVEKVLKRLLEEGISVNYAKSSFGLQEVKYLGKIINEKGIRPDLDSLIKLDNFKIPHDRKGLMKLLGLINWFRDHVPNLSQRLGSITSKLTKNGKFNWSAEDTKTIISIKKSIEEQTLLHHPDISKPFLLTTDASENGLGAILTQEGCIVGIYSYKLKNSELNYTTTEKELYAIIRALQHFRSFILGSNITVETDHHNLLFVTSCISNRAQRWKLVLEEYNVTLKHIKGCDNAAANALSRCLTLKTNENTEALDYKKISEAYDHCRTIQGLNRDELNKNEYL